MGDCHARFCERLELKCSGLLDSFSKTLGSSSLLVQDIILGLSFLVFCRLFIRFNKWLIKKHV